MTAHLPPGAVPAQDHPAAAPVSAPIGRRVGAYAIDLAIAVALSLVILGISSAAFGGLGASSTGAASVALGALLSALLLGLVMLAWWWGVYTGMQAGRGSIGQRALGLRLADAATGAPIGFGRALLRNLVWGLAGSVVIGYFTPLLDASSRRQGWHDSAARAVVVDTRAERAHGAASSFAGGASAATTPPIDQSWPSDFPIPSHAFLATGAHPQVAPSAPPPAPGVPSPVAPGFPPPMATPAAAPALHAPSPGHAQAPASPSPSPTWAVASPPPAATPPAESPMISHVPGITAGGPVALASVVSVPPAPAVVPAAPAAPATDDLDATRAVASVAPPASRAALYAEAPVLAVLVWDDGSRMAVYGHTLYGRNPAAEAGAVTVTVRDETLSLSKTHFEIGGEPGATWVADRHSTNGTVLVRDGMRHPLSAGARTPLRPGDRLECGDRFAGVEAAP